MSGFVISTPISGNSEYQGKGGNASANANAVGNDVSDLSVSALSVDSVMSDSAMQSSSSMNTPILGATPSEDLQVPAMTNETVTLVDKLEHTE